METLNLNVGLLGHVDSGKTSLAKVLSSVASTAAFDKNPQSQERGITIDLGFSSFTVDTPAHFPESQRTLQFTLVDCPGHASLIKTIIGGVHIIDFMLLIVDVTKGIQTQTAECLILGEIMSKKIIIVLNKIDLLDNKRLIEKTAKKIKNTLKDTIFHDCPIVSVSAKSEEESVGIEALINTMKQVASLPIRDTTKPFLFAVDHCFSIKGKGTVLTGTVLQGSIKINEEIDLPSIKLIKKVKSIQMFKKPIESANQGDRVGICVTQFDPKLLERGLACHIGYVSYMYAAIINFNKVKYFKGSISSKSKFHTSIGYETVLANITLFGSNQCSTENLFDINNEYEYINEISDETIVANTFALLEFEKGIIVVPESLTICSKLDLDIHSNSCRLAFYGSILFGFTDKNYSKEILKIYKEKSKKGTVERFVDNHTLIGKNMFKRESNIEKFIGMKVNLSTGECGTIQSSFGQSGKFKISIPGGLNEFTASSFNTNKKKNKEEEKNTPVEIMLHHKRFIFDPKKRMLQS